MSFDDCGSQFHEAATHGDYVVGSRFSFGMVLVFRLFWSRNAVTHDQVIAAIVPSCCLI